MISYIHHRDYKTCPHCKSNLDFGERCDCQDKIESPKTKGLCNAYDASYFLNKINVNQKGDLNNEYINAR